MDPCMTGLLDELEAQETRLVFERFDDDDRVGARRRAA